jgi:uncharacterized protein
MVKFTIYTASSNLYYFRLTTNNGQVLLTSEGYHSKAGCSNGVETVRIIGKAEKNYERKTASNGMYYFYIKAMAGQTLGTSEMYGAVTARDNAINAVQSIVADAMVNDETVPEIIYLIKEKRKQLGLTQLQLAEKAGVGLRFLRELEQGKSTLRIDKVNQVLQLFGYQMGPVLKNRNNLHIEES